MPAGVWIGERFVSTSELMLNAARAATGFRDLGVATGDTVALLMRNDVPFLESSLAASMLAATAVPLNWHSVANEIEYILADCQAKVLVAHSDLLRSLPGLMVPESTHLVIVETPAEIVDAWKLTPADAMVHEDDVVWHEWIGGKEPMSASAQSAASSVIYTSGTTGVPKGVKRMPLTETQRGALGAVLARLTGITSGDSTIISAPLYHTAPNATALHAVAVGASVVLQPKFDPEQLLELIERNKVTVLQLVPTMFSQLLSLSPEQRDSYDMSSLRYVVHTAAPCPPEIKRKMIDWWGPVIYEYYGSTEAGAVTFCSSEEWLTHPGTVGKAIPEASVKVFDERGIEVTSNTVGEIYSKLNAISDFTYLGDDEKRRSLDSHGLIKSGDLGYLDDEGYLYICDRKTDMIIFGGSNIYSAEIEAVMLTIPGIQDVAVFGIPDKQFGERPAAAVQLTAGTALDTETILVYLRDRISGYKIPRMITFHDNLPREETGKIFKRKLRDPYWKDVVRKI
jgi:long-chain acyl-CoA synthetase